MSLRCHVPSLERGEIRKRGNWWHYPTTHCVDDCEDEMYFAPARTFFDPGDRIEVTQFSKDVNEDGDVIELPVAIRELIVLAVNQDTGAVKTAKMTSLRQKRAPGAKVNGGSS